MTPRASSAVRRHCHSRRCLERPQERNPRPANGPGLAQEGHRRWSSGPAASKARMEGGGRHRGDSRSLVWVAGVEPALASGGGRTRSEKMLHLVCPLPALSSPRVRRGRGPGLCWPLFSPANPSLSLCFSWPHKKNDWGQEGM